MKIVSKLKYCFEDLEILIVGDGRNFKTIKKKTQEINKNIGKDVIKMLGNQTQVAKLINISDVFIGVSRAALESLMVGKPVILSGNQGYLGILNEQNFNLAQKTNFCARGQNLPNCENLLRDIKFLLKENPKKLKAMIEFNKKMVQKFYSVEKMVKDVLNVYNVISKKN